MTSPPDFAAYHDDLEIDEDQVAAYLRRHPDFLVKHPELLRTLAPPSRANGGPVLDMQTFMIERLRDDIAGLERHREALVAARRRSLSKQNQVHEAVIAMLGATTFEHFIEVVTGDFARLLHVDVVTLCVEGNGEVRRRCNGTGLRGLEPGAVDALFGDAGGLRLGTEYAGDPDLFGSGAGLVRSAALVRLCLEPGPRCLLALGSRREDRFETGRGGEPLGFLARVLEHCLRVWLDLPAWTTIRR